VNNKGGWVIDGNYTSHVGDLLDKEATDIICECFPIAQMAAKC
jgi:hypothetical protein